MDTKNEIEKDREGLSERAKKTIDDAVVMLKRQLRGASPSAQLREWYHSQPPSNHRGFR